MVGARLVRLGVSDKLLDDGKPIGLLCMARERRGAVASLRNAHSGRTAEIDLWC
mgnify:CR=1 FL=1